MQIFNTLTRQKDTFEPIEPGKVSVYACGPTVYNFFHLGNARPFITFDTLRRYLEYKGYEVNFVQNFTDIDDKVIRRANEENVSYDVIADRYIKEYFTDAAGLNIKRASTHPKATDCIPEIIEMIQTLFDKGLAYVGNDGVYYSARGFKNYCCLSHFSVEDLQQNVRKDVMTESGKRDSLDFALWKFRKPNEPYWPSPWGEGRPGWHIECSVMSKKYLGETIDIHGGGQDLIFPHHENEIAQSEGASGKTFVHYWMHNGFITVEKEKMSKSLGNFFTVRDIANEFGYMPIRLFMLSSQYRSPINYTTELMAAAKSSYERILTCYRNLCFALEHLSESSVNSVQAEHFARILEQQHAAFDEAMDDDMNTASALASVFELVREVNTALAAPEDYAVFKEAKCLLVQLCEVLGLVLDIESTIPAEIIRLADERQVAKKNKDFAKADAIRELLVQKGYKITDTPKGPQIEAL